MVMYKQVNGQTVQMTAEQEQAVLDRQAAQQAKYNDYVANEKYKDDRKKAYPSVGDQLDALWHGMDTGLLTKVPAFYDPIKAVKDTHPKPA